MDETTPGVSPEPLLVVRDLSVEYATRPRPTRVIRHLDLTLGRGEFVGVVGESGSGKSTLAYAILALIPAPGRATGGEILFGRHGNLLALPELAMSRLRGNRLAMIFQGAQSVLNPVRRIGQQVDDVLVAHRVARDAGMRRARDLLAATQLEPDRVLRSFPHELSGGMRQRVAIAMALLLSPDLLILDEPTSALDVVSQAAILELLATLRHQFQVALLFITHDFAVVSSQADRIAVMYAGRIVEAGPAEAVYRAPRHPYTRGLIRALPNVRGPLRPLVALDGTPPDLSDDLVGCPFAPRCPLADVACASYEPRLVAVGPGHEAACRKAGMEEAG